MLGAGYYSILSVIEKIIIAITFLVIELYRRYIFKKLSLSVCLFVYAGLVATGDPPLNTPIWVLYTYIEFLACVMFRGLLKGSSFP